MEDAESSLALASQLADKGQIKVKSWTAAWVEIPAVGMRLDDQEETKLCAMADRMHT